MNPPLLQHEYTQQEEDFLLGDFYDADLDFGVDDDIIDGVQDYGITAGSDDGAPSGGGAAGAGQFTLYQDSATTFATRAWTGNYLGNFTFAATTGNTLSSSQDVYLEITLVVGTGISAIALYTNAAGAGVTNSGTVRYLYLGTVTWASGAISALVATVFQNGELMPCGSFIWCFAGP